MELIPLWRLREIRNIADTIAFRAASCAIAGVVVVTEDRHLKTKAHVRMVIDHTRKPGEAHHYVQCFGRGDSKWYLVTIHFNGDLSTKRGWTATAKAILRQLAYVCLFSKAARRPWVDDPRDPQFKERLVDAFTQTLLRKRQVDFVAYRPRFSLARLRHLVRRKFGAPSHFLERHIQRLLAPYLGPDGW